MKMLQVKDYPGYSILQVSTYHRNQRVFSISRPRISRGTCVRLEPKAPSYIKMKEEITEGASEISENDTLYFAPGCTLPRIQAAEFWTIKKKPTAATITILPREFGYINARTFHVFVSDIDRMILIGYEEFYNMMTNGNSIFSIEQNNYYSEGAPLWTNPDCKTNFKYAGLLDLLPDTPLMESFFNAAYKLYPRYAFENTLLTKMSGENRNFTSEVITSLTEMLLSSDTETVKTGMRIIASMDYIKYHTVIYKMLKDTEYRWRDAKPFNSAATFMLKELEKRRFEPLTQEEYEGCKEIIDNMLYRDIQHLYKRCCEIKGLKVDITLKTSFDNEVFKSGS